MSGQLPSRVEAAGLVRRAEAAGDFATVVRKGDPDRGALLLVVSSRGREVSCLERRPTLAGGYEWHVTGPEGPASSTNMNEFLAKRTRFDEDLWIIELDVAEPERFIAETTSRG
jgi:hypothetical protein